MLRNTSFKANLNPTRFSSTANNIFILFESKPVTDLCAVPYAAVLTNACDSTSNGRAPSTVTPIAAPDKSESLSDNSSSDGFATSRNPDCVISYMPISDVLPNLFFIERNNRYM